MNGQDAALRYSNLGVRVFPCDARKKPLIKEWQHAASWDRGTITEWWNRWPDALVATPDFDVVDADLYKPGAEASFTRVEPHLRDARVVMLTPQGGKQFYYEGGTGAPQGQNTPTLPGVDTRAKGRGYTILHGPGYEYERGSVMGLFNLTPFPEEVAALLKHSSNGVTSVAGSESVESELFMRIVEALDARPARSRNGEPKWNARCPLPHATGNKSRTSLAIWPHEERVATFACSARCDHNKVWAELERRGVQRETQERAPADGYLLVDLDQVEALPVEWVEKNYLARGELHILQGEGGSFKGFYTFMLAAEFSRRKEHVLIIQAEDSLEKKVKPALMAAGADMRYIHPLRIRRGDDTDAVEIPKDLPVLRNAIEDHHASLVVIDPLLTHISGKKDAYRDHEMKRVLTPIGVIAQETNSVVLCVHHTKKDVSGGMKTAGQGSTAFYTTARIQLTMVKLSEDEAVVEVTKSNIGPEGERYLVRKEDITVKGATGGIDIIRLVRAGESPVSVEEALRGVKRGDRSKTEKARIRMLDILDEEGDQPQGVLFDRVATECNLKPGTVRREVYFGDSGLRTEDLVNSRKEGFQGDWIVYRTGRERPEKLRG